LFKLTSSLEHLTEFSSGKRDIYREYNTHPAIITATHQLTNSPFIFTTHQNQSPKSSCQGLGVGTPGFAACLQPWLVPWCMQARNDGLGQSQMQ